MIKLDIQYVISAYVALSIIGLMVLWIFSGRPLRPKIRNSDKAGIWKCVICSNDYIDSTSEEISCCPLCGSYNKRAEKEVSR